METPLRQIDEFIGQKMLSKRKCDMSPVSLKEGKFHTSCFSNYFC